MARKSDLEEGNLFSFDREEKGISAAGKTGRKKKADSREKTGAAEKKEIKTTRKRGGKGKAPKEEEPALFAMPPETPPEKKGRGKSSPEAKRKAKSAAGKTLKKTAKPASAPQIKNGSVEIPEKSVPSGLSAGEMAAAKAWKEKFWEFDLTKPSQYMKDTMKESMLSEGFGKREANKVFKGLFFKEKVCNTKTQAVEYLLTIPNSYAVKYKIGIPPSPQMEKLEKRLHEKEERLEKCKEEGAKKFQVDFLTCPHCKSRVNTKFVHPPLCPVCGEDLRSETAIKTLTTLEEAVKDLSKRYEDTARRYNAKFTGGEKWVVHLVNPLYDGEDDSKGK